MSELEQLKDSPADLRIIKSYVEGLLQPRDYGANPFTGVVQPEVGKEYDIGDNKNGYFRVKVIKNRRRKALVQIITKLATP